MKRSEINALIRETMAFLDEMNYKLPPFAYWSPEDWKHKGSEYDEIRNNHLGWDITDFDSDDFHRVGLLLFTIRNGNPDNRKYTKTYAEKLLITEEEQITPLHFHRSKMEDIINRGGGNLLMQVYNSTDDEEFADTPVEVSVDGKNYVVEAGSIIRLTPGESITMPTRQYHRFWGEKGTGICLLGEVSQVNDDRIDNRFYDNLGRYPKIEEDEAPLYLLVNEYPVAE